MDPVLNFAKVSVSTGYNETATSIVLASGHGAKLPQPSTDGAFNLVWHNSTDYPDPADDPNIEIVRVTARTGDTLTVTRGQESIPAQTHNITGKVYKMILALTKKTWNDIITRSAIRGGGTGKIFNLTLGSIGTPLTAGDNPVVIDHVNDNNTGLSYAVWIKTRGSFIDRGSGFVVENQGASDGATFAIASGNTIAGACAIGLLMNNLTDVHDQYLISAINRHGRVIMIQSQGTGEALEIRRNANNSGTAKSGSHIFINENMGDFGHLIGLKMDGHATLGSDSDIMLQFRKGTTPTFEVQKGGNLALYGGSIYMDNSRPIFIKNFSGTWRNILTFNGSNQLDIGTELTSGSLRMNIDGTIRTVSLGANDSGGTGFRVLRVPNP